MIFFLFSINCFYLFTSLFFHNVLIDIKHALVKTPKIDHVGHFYQGSILVIQVKNLILLFYCMTSIHLTRYLSHIVPSSSEQWAADASSRANTHVKRRGLRINTHWDRIHPSELR